MRRNASRREFITAASMTAGAALSLATNPSFGAEPAGMYQVFRAAELAGDAQALSARPGNSNLVTEKSFLVVMTVEVAKSAREFEWHEGRDHVVQILEGETVYEVGGKPRDGRNTKQGEWLAPASEGATTLTLKKGDMLTLPRGTPHKRSTAVSVTFLLISAQ